MITLRDAIHRAYKLLGVGVIALTGIAFSLDLPAEIDQFTHIVDEVLLAVLAIIAVVWYLMGPFQGKKKKWRKIRENENNSDQCL